MLILPFIEQDALFQSSKIQGPPPNNYQYYNNWGGTGSPGILDKVVKAYNCPSDFTSPDGKSPDPTDWGVTSYAFNAQLFTQTFEQGSLSPPTPPPQFVWPRYPQSLPDGTSSTIMFAEKYGSILGPDPWANDYGSANVWWEWAPRFAWAIQGPSSKFLVQPKMDYCLATKANDMDGYPPASLLTGNPDTTTGAAITSVCQLLATGLHSGGMNVALGDGSVHFLAGTIGGDVWWSLVTPNGGEIVDGSAY